MSEPPQPELRALLVDDNELDAKLGRAVLERAGYRVSEARDGEGALARAAQERFDVIFLDLQLPDRAGVEVVRELRSREAGRRARVFALTAGSTGIDGATCIAAGFDACLTKPLGAQALAGALAEPQSTGAIATSPALDLEDGSASAFDRSRLLALAGGDASLVAELEQAFVRDALPLCERLNAALAGAASKPAVAAAHALKGLLLNLCAARGAELARRLEHALSQQQLERARALALPLASEVQRLRDQLEASAGAA